MDKIATLRNIARGIAIWRVCPEDRFLHHIPTGLLDTAHWREVHLDGPRRRISERKALAKHRLS